MTALIECRICKRMLEPRCYSACRKHRGGLQHACKPCIADARRAARPRPAGFAAEKYPALSHRHDRLVRWDGGPTRVTVHGVTTVGSQWAVRAYVSEGGGTMYLVPAGWLVENSEPIA